MLGVLVEAAAVGVKAGPVLPVPGREMGTGGGPGSDIAQGRRQPENSRNLGVTGDPKMVTPNKY